MNLTDSWGAEIQNKDSHGSDVPIVTMTESYHTHAKPEGSAPVAVGEEWLPEPHDGLMKYFLTWQ